MGEKGRKLGERGNLIKQAEINVQIYLLMCSEKCVGDLERGKEKKKKKHDDNWEKRN